MKSWANFWLLTTLLLVWLPEFNTANPFRQFKAKFKENKTKRKEQQLPPREKQLSSGEDITGVHDEDLKELINLRQGFGNVRINTNSRDEVLASALNMISSVSSALIYTYLIRVAMRGVKDLIAEFSRNSALSGNVTNGALPSSFEKRFIPDNVTLNSYELDILSSSVVDPNSIDTNFEHIGGLRSVKQGLLDCCDLCLGLDLMAEEGGEHDKVLNLAEATAKIGTVVDGDTEKVLKTSIAARIVARENDKDKAVNGTTTAVAATNANGASSNATVEIGLGIAEDRRTSSILTKRSGSLLRPVQGVLLYGPPGCGKTALTRSLSRKCQLPMVQISPSTLLRKWVGDTSQLTKAIFTLCHKLQPCILFIDEMDGLFRSRREDDNAVDRQIKTEFMQLWDELSRSKDSRVMVVGATNRPQDLDAAIQRRFERSYFVDMPNEAARNSIVRKLLKSSNVAVATHFDYKACATMTTGYSPSDIVNLFKAAACIPLRELQKSRRKPGNGNSTSSGSGLRPLSLADVEEAMQSLGQPTQWTAQGYQESPHHHRRSSDAGVDNPWPIQPGSHSVGSPFNGNNREWGEAFGGLKDEGGISGATHGGDAGAQADSPWRQQSQHTDDLYNDYDDYSDEEDEKSNDSNDSDNDDDDDDGV